MTAEVKTNYHIVGSPTLIVRDGEVFDIKKGLGLYSKRVQERYKANKLPNDTSIWLPGETQEVESLIQAGKSVLIRGDLGAGKSSIIYGLRSKYRAAQRPYYYIDGHFKGTEPEAITRKLHKAQSTRTLVIWDSTDYLLGQSRKIVTGNRDKHTQRSETLLGELSSFVENSGKLIATSHTTDWIKSIGNINLFNGPWKKITERMAIHDVRGVFESPETAAFFYVNAGLSNEQAHYLAHLETNPCFKLVTDMLAEMKKLTDQERLDLENAPKTYKNAKLFALDPRDEALAARHALDDFSKGEITQEQFLTIYALFTVNKNKETVRKRQRTR